MDQSFLAFRCVGNFAWPPVTKAPKTIPLVFHPGIVEVHYVKSKAGSWIGCVRWIGKSQFTRDEIDSGSLWKPLTTPLQEIRELKDLSDAALAKDFVTHGGSTDPKEQALTFRFDASFATNDANGRLRFEGAHLLEQFGAPSEKELEERAAELEANGVVAPPALKLRLPLVRKPYSEATEQGTTDWYSSLQIGTDKSSNRVRVDIAVALALPGSSRQWNAGRAICPFGTIFDGSPDAAEVATWREGARFNTLTYGLRSKDRDVDAHSLANWLGDCEISLQNNIPASMLPSIEDVIERMLPASGISIVSRKGQSATQGFKLASVGGTSLRPFPGIRIAQEDAGRSFAIHQRVALKLSGDPAPIDEGESDLRVRKKQIELRMKGQPDVWVPFGAEIYFAVTMRGSVSEELVWTDLSSARQSADLRIDVTLGSEQEVYPEKPTASYSASLPGMLQAALTDIKPTMDSLRRVHSPQPQSSFPVLEYPAYENGKKHFGIFASVQKGVLFIPGEPVLLRQFSPAELRDRFWAGLQTADIAFAGSVDSATAMGFNALWPSWDGTSKVSTLVSLRHHRVGGAGGVNFLALRLWSDPNASGLHRSVLGGFRFTHSKARALDKNAASVLSIAPGRIRIVQHFLLTGVDPVAVDVPRFDRTGRVRPLLMQGKPGKEVDYVLVINESLDTLNEWQLTAQLLERAQSSESGARPRVLLSETPFAFQRFYSQPLETRGGQEGVTVAAYDSDTGVWQLKQVARVYGYTLPPQSVGESMDKPGRLEIHDAQPAPADSFIRPIPADGSEAAASGLARLYGEFRLTPPANLWIQPGDVQRGFIAPEWASREIFRQRAELGVGAALSAFRGEFVYGLAVGIRPDLERGPSRRTRVAEIEALTGRLIDKAPADQDGLEARWSKLHDAFQRRPERLELWADDPDSQIPFAPARFTRGASFALRTTALHRPAVADLEPSLRDGPGTPTQRIEDLSPRLHPQGLSGGALWPIESRNVLNMVLDAPGSSGGSIESR